MFWKMLVAALAVACAPGRAANYVPRVNGGEDIFTGAVPRVEVEIPPEGLKVLREYVQVWRKPRPERIDMPATVREGGRTYTNVAVHLKGSFSFQPVDGKPSFTLNFDKFAPGQRFHGLAKIHLNNSVQDPTYLSEQLARELFAEAGVPSARAGQARVKLNGRDLGLCVMIEGEDKRFVKRNFKSAKGNLYDGGSGGEVTKVLKATSGEDRENRTDLTNLVQAAREPDPVKRLARLEAVLDVERFISFAATEAFLVHWDGYAIGGNNYRVFHDVSRDKMVFLPSGMDQLFGVSSTAAQSLTPVFKGMIAKRLFSVPEARRRYLARVEALSTNEFRATALHARVDRLAARVRPALADDKAQLGEFEQEVRDLKTRITQRTVSVAQQLKNPKRPVTISEETGLRLPSWSFKGGPTLAASGSRSVAGNRQLLQVTGRGPESSGAWRTTVFLGEGHYEFTGLARTEGLTAEDAQGTNGVMLRISGERSTQGLAITGEWKALHYEFDVHGVEDEELVCEFRGARGGGSFDAGSLRLFRRGEARNGPEAE